MQSHERIDQHNSSRPARRRTADMAAQRTTENPPHRLTMLQRFLGNAHVARLLAQREAPPEDEPLASRDSASESAIPEVGPEGGQISDALSSRINAQRGAARSIPEP